MSRSLDTQCARGLTSFEKDGECDQCRQPLWPRFDPQLGIISYFANRLTLPTSGLYVCFFVEFRTVNDVAFPPNIIFYHVLWTIFAAQNRNGITKIRIVTFFNHAVAGSGRNAVNGAALLSIVHGTDYALACYFFNALHVYSACIRCGVISKSINATNKNIHNFFF